MTREEQKSAFRQTAFSKNTSQDNTVQFPHDTVCALKLDTISIKF